MIKLKLPLLELSNKTISDSSKILTATIFNIGIPSQITHYITVKQLTLMINYFNYKTSSVFLRLSIYSFALVSEKFDRRHISTSTFVNVNVVLFSQIFAFLSARALHS